LLYVGLGLVCIGLIITVVGLGEKGFQTLQANGWTCQLEKRRCLNRIFF
jgi:hypothetical protein